MLNAELVTAKIKEHGWTRSYVIAQLGLGREGYPFLRGEWLPKNGVRKTLLLKKLSKLIGVELPKIILRLEAVKTA